MFHDPTWEIVFTVALLLNSPPAGCVKISDAKRDYSDEAAKQRADYLRGLSGTGSWHGLGAHCGNHSQGWK